MRKAIVVMAMLAFVAPASANLLGPTWSEYVAGWGSGSFPINTQGTVQIQTGGGSNVAYQVIDVIPGEEYVLSGWATQTSGSSSYWTEVLLFDYTGQNLAGGDGIDAPAPDPNIQLKSDGWGMNQDVLKGAGAPFDVNIWGYPNNPARSMTITAAGSQIVVAVKVGASGGSNDTTFSDMVLLPEPASALLLGLPMLFLRRRR